MKPAVLLVDDDVAACAALQSRLTARGFRVVMRDAGRDALEALLHEDIDVLVTDMNVRDMTGVELCKLVLEHRPVLPVILITAVGSMEMAIDAIRAGAYDFLPRPFEIQQLAVAIERAATLGRLRDEVQRLRRIVAPPVLGDLVGDSPRMRELYAQLSKIAETDVTVLITGESGTGKELAARALHGGGPRAAGPFVAINCAAMPPTLLESELFGHAKGAFTDARVAKPGLFQLANGGTLFLDEVGELPLELQPKLLRALQERTIRPVGGTTEIPFDARLITATNRDIEHMVEAQRFREDLFFRINVVAIALPPLRARGGDVLLLARHFLERIAPRVGKRVLGFSVDAAHKLMAYSWPGNVRELENCVEHAVALTSYDQISVADLPERVRTFRVTQMLPVPDDPSMLTTLEQVEQRYVARVLAAVDGNKTAAARILGIERRTLYRMLDRWGGGTAATTTATPNTNTTTR